jgi:hypothetical protein
MKTGKFSVVLGAFLIFAFVTICFFFAMATRPNISTVVWRGKCSGSMSLGRSIS